jgi:hypothetical protein
MLHRTSIKNGNVINFAIQQANDHECKRVHDHQRERIKRKFVFLELDVTE